MSKEFQKFKNTMNPTVKSLGAALSSTTKVVEAKGKTTDPSKKQVSHYMDRTLLELLGVLKARSGRTMSELYEEAISDILAKYNIH